LLSPMYTPVPGIWEERPLAPAIARIAAGSFRGKTGAQVRGTGYVVDSLQAAVWAFATGADFREGCLLAANLGDDADTTAAIHGQLAGAHYGAGGDLGIPVDWVDRLAHRELIERLADRLYELSEAPPPWP
ncbi:MAG: ADP-ribosylglycohydrolase family protein, partial [Thermoplasmata archaeon]